MVEPIHSNAPVHEIDTKNVQFKWPEICTATAVVVASVFFFNPVAAALPLTLRYIAVFQLPIVLPISIFLNYLDPGDLTDNAKNISTYKAVFLGPAVEEVLFRKVGHALFDKGIASTIFGLAHISNGKTIKMINVCQAIQTGIAGYFLFGTLYAQFGLITSIASHAIFNLSAITSIKCLEEIGRLFETSTQQDTSVPAG